MIIAVPKETASGERRVALVPATLPSLAKPGHTVRVEKGAGAAAGFPDQAYLDKGATIVDGRDALLEGADVVLAVRAGAATAGAGQPIAVDDLANQLRPGQLLLSFLDPLGSPDSAKLLAERKVSSFALELLPRITRAQSMDALSSQASIAGYRAVLLAASHLPRMFPMLTTAAGTIAPAKVLVVGAGVAGLQAIATARRLGAVVSGYDVRKEVKEQIQSLGARFVELALEEAATGTGGYAAAQSDEYYARQRQLLGEVVAQNDVLITTAAIPGRKSPVLVNADAIEAMAPGSVVVDLAAERGGNVQSTRSGEVYQLANSTTIAGPLNLPGEVPYHASQMLSKNLATLLLHLLGKEGRVNYEADDQITRETALTRDGEVASPRVRQLLGLPALEPAAVA